MRKTAHLSVVIGLVLALSYAAPAGHSAPAPGDSKTEGKGTDAIPEQQEMRGLDEQVQGVKSDVLSIAAEMNQLE